MIFDEIIITFNNLEKVPTGFTNVGPGSYEFVTHGKYDTWLEITLDGGRRRMSIPAHEVYSVYGNNPPLQ